jgi:LysR family hydrogen peroxide-inducible transcriptional activator
MELHQLRYFVATAEAGSVSRAARRCRVAQPSLSLQVRKLERTLGSPLFDRHGRGMALTDAGHALLPRARAILAAVRDAEENLGRDVDRGLGRAAIGAIPTIAPYLLPPALRTLRRELPGCELVIREDLTDHLIEALLDNHIDCAIMSTPPPSSHGLITFETLADEELVVLAPADSRLSAEHIVAMADLRQQPIITLLDMHCLGQQIEGFCTSRGLAPKVVCRTAQIQTIIEMVGLGLGISIVPEMAVIGQARLKSSWARLRTARPHRPITAVWRRDRQHAVAATRLVDIIRRNLARGLHTLPPHER